MTKRSREEIIREAIENTGADEEGWRDAGVMYLAREIDLALSRQEARERHPSVREGREVDEYTDVADAVGVTGRYTDDVEGGDEVSTFGIQKEVVTLDEYRVKREEARKNKLRNKNHKPPSRW